MIKSIKHKELAALWAGKRTKIDSKQHKRILRRLDVIDSATSIEDLNIPGFNFHSLRGFNPTRYTIHINGPWCVTLEFHDGNAYLLDYEQYH